MIPRWSLWIMLSVPAVLATSAGACGPGTESTSSGYGGTGEGGWGGSEPCADSFNDPIPSGKFQCGDVLCSTETEFCQEQLSVECSVFYCVAFTASCPSGCDCAAMLGCTDDDCGLDHGGIHAVCDG